jgi:hypothetical protein
MRPTLGRQGLCDIEPCDARFVAVLVQGCRLGVRDCAIRLPCVPCVGVVQAKRLRSRRVAKFMADGFAGTA